MSHDSHDYFSRLDSALEAAGMAWWEIELPSGAIFFSENKTKMLGYDKEGFFHYTAFTNLIHPDDYPSAMKAMSDHIQAKAPVYQTRYRIKAKDGSYRTFFDKGKVVSRNGSEVKVAGVVMDITDIDL